MSDILDFRRGTYKIVRVDGTELLVLAKPNLAEIEKAIEATYLDTVIVRRRGRDAELVMMVDDTGMLDGKPANATATTLYHAVCRPGTVHQIHGDVAIVWDRDFKQ